MAPSETQFENLKKRVKDLEAVRGTVPDTSKKTPWLTIIMIGISLLALGVATLAWLQPQYSANKQTDFNNSVDGRIDLKLKEPNEKLNKIGMDIAEINGTLKAWAPFMTPQVFKKNIALPDKDFIQSLPEIKAAAQLGSESRTAIPTSSLADVGKRTLRLASGAVSGKLAWETTAALLQYRSVLNGFSPPKEVGLAKPIDQKAITTHYNFARVPGYTAPNFAVVSIATPESQAAAMDYIGSDENKNMPVGAAFLIGTGGGIKLDNMHLRNVILMNTLVSYTGTTPANLENVYFLNCTFQITNDSRGTQLAGKILTSGAPAINVSLS